MARSTEDVRRDIEETRDELGSTLEAIGDRVAPKKVVGRVKSNVAGKVEDVKDRVSPLRLVRRGTDGVRNSLRSRNGGGDSADPNGFALPSARANGGGNGGSPRSTKELASRAGETAGSVASRAGETADSVAARVGDAAGSVADQARSAPTSLRQRAEDNPLVAGLVVFGGGFLLATRLAPSERERRLTVQAKERLQPVRERALETGRGMAEDLKGVAQDGVNEVRARALGAATQVKDEALVLAEKVKEDARTSAEQVKGEAVVATEDVQGEARVATRRVKAKTENAKAATTSMPRVRRAPASGHAASSGRTSAKRAPDATAR